MHNQENDVWFLAQVRNGRLSVSEAGIVINNDTGRKIGATGSGRYPKISITDGKRDGKWSIRHMQIHRLVWLSHRGLIPYGKQLNHKDLNKSNPSLINLELVTQSENSIHAMKHGALTLFKKGNQFHKLRKSYGKRCKILPTK